MPTSYPPEILQERSHVLHELAGQDFPEAHGVVIDGVGTSSHEQGIWLSDDGHRAELFVVDSTGFRAGGYTDAHGLVHIASSNTRNQETKGSRLFVDPLIYRRLNLSEPACPAIRFSLDQVPGGPWRVQGMDRVKFFADEVSDASPQNRDITLTEYDLEQAVGDWLEDIQAEHHIGFLRDREGRMAAHRPLREWSDFKNLQIATDLFVHRAATSVLTKTTHARAQGHISGSDSDTIPDVTEAQRILGETANIESRLVTMLSLPDIARYKLPSEDFRLLTEAVLDEEVDIQKVTGIGVLTGAIAVRQACSGFTVIGGGKEMHVTDWDEFLIGLLQATDRSEDYNQARQRRVVQKVQARAAEEKKALRAFNTLRAKAAGRFSIPVGRIN
jgi:hypothetical protein